MGRVIRRAHKRAKADADRRAQVELIASQKKRELATTPAHLPTEVAHPPPSWATFPKGCRLCPGGEQPAPVAPAGGVGWSCTPRVLAGEGVRSSEPRLHHPIPTERRFPMTLDIWHDDEGV